MLQAEPLKITAGDEAFQAETSILISDGTFDITTGGGADACTKHSGGNGDQMGGGQMNGGQMGGPAAVRIPEPCPTFSGTMPDFGTDSGSPQGGTPPGGMQEAPRPDDRTVQRPGRRTGQQAVRLQ